MTNKFFIILFLLGFSLSSCLKDRIDDLTETAEELDEAINGSSDLSANISDAQGLFISEDQSTTKKKLYKITAEGAKEVEYTDKDGNKKTDILAPEFLLKVSDEYLIIRFLNDEEFYLMKKSNGKIFKLSLQKIVDKGFLYIREKAVQDSEGNIYLKVYENYYGGTFIVKINMTDYSLERLTPENHSIISFLIDRDDNLFYLGGNTGYDGEYIFYCLTPDKKLYKFIANRYWKDAKGNIFVFAREFEGEHHDFILSVNVTDTGLKFNYFSKNNDYWLTSLGHVIGDRVYGICFNYKYGEQTMVFDLTEKDNITENVYNGTLLQTHIDGRYVYSLQADKDFKKFDPVTGVFTQIWKNDPDLEIYGDITLSENGTINFSAFQLSTRKNIMAQIDAGGTFSVAATLSENNKIVYIERFN